MKNYIKTILILGLFILPVSTNTVVSIPDVYTSHNTTVAINVTNANNLGAAYIRLHYNSEVVQVTDVTMGDLSIPELFCYNINNMIGVVNITGVKAEGVNGDVVFANVVLEAVGELNDISPLNLEVITLKDTSGISIPYITENGTFNIILEGDTNLDGCVNIIDAMFIAQYVVGLRNLSQSQIIYADVNKDNTVNIIDAMKIAQSVVV